MFWTCEGFCSFVLADHDFFGSAALRGGFFLYGSLALLCVILEIAEGHLYRRSILVVPFAGQDAEVAVFVSIVYKTVSVVYAAAPAIAVL